MKLTESKLREMVKKELLSEYVDMSVIRKYLSSGEEVFIYAKRTLYRGNIHSIKDNMVIVKPYGRGVYSRIPVDSIISIKPTSEGRRFIESEREVEINKRRKEIHLKRRELGDEIKGLNHELSGLNKELSTLKSERESKEFGEE